MTKRTTLEMVREFHTTYGAVTTDKPTLGDLSTNQLRYNLLKEELDELKEALDTGDVQEAFDALIDLQYVLDGAFLALGFHSIKDEGFNEVHRSNMSKLGADGKPILREGDNKVLKGPNYFKPNLKKVLTDVYPELKNKEAA